MAKGTSPLALLGYILVIGITSFVLWRLGVITAAFGALSSLGKSATSTTDNKDTKTTTIDPSKESPTGDSKGTNDSKTTKEENNRDVKETHSPNEIITFRGNEQINLQPSGYTLDVKVDPRVSSNFRVVDGATIFTASQKKQPSTTNTTKQTKSEQTTTRTTGQAIKDNPNQKQQDAIKALFDLQAQSKNAIASKIVAPIDLRGTGLTTQALVQKAGSKGKTQKIETVNISALIKQGIDVSKITGLSVLGIKL